MTITYARRYAQAWSMGGKIAVVIRAREGEFVCGYYWERANPAIPPDQVVETYRNGELVSDARPERQRGE